MDYEKARRDLLLSHDILSGLYARIKRAEAEDENGSGSELSKVGYRVRNAMDSLAEALGVLEMWGRQRQSDVGDFDPADQDDSDGESALPA